MYKAIYDENHKAIGFVGLGIFTDGLLGTLNNIEIRGVENSFYTMVNTNDGTYIFNSDNTDLVGQPVEEGDLLNLSNEVKGTYDERSDNFEYTKNNDKYVCIYSYIPKYNWILTIDDPKSEVYKLTTTMRTYLGIFGALILAMTIVFYFISKRQERINQKLVSTIAKNSQTKKSLNAAMFTDVLTNVNNRISFSMDLEKADEKKPYYFLMFNIKDFSGINTMFGNDAGDRLLIRTVEVLRENFPDYNIYRTGSDEFVVMIPTENGAPLAENVIDNVNTAFRQLLVPEKTENQGTIYPKYKVAVCKKVGEIDTSVVTVLKDMTNRTGEATYGLIDYLDLTNQ
jgi:diguanylate cyclase (GGDEF)-like protein